MVELNLKQMMSQRAKRIMWIVNKTTEKIVKKELKNMQKQIKKEILGKLKEK